MECNMLMHRTRDCTYVVVCLHSSTVAYHLMQSFSYKRMYNCIVRTKMRNCNVHFALTENIQKHLHTCCRGGEEGGRRGGVLTLAHGCSLVEGKERRELEVGVRQSWAQGMWSLGVPRVSSNGVGLVSMDTGGSGCAGWLHVGVGLTVGSQVVATPGLEVMVGLFPVLWEVGVHRVILLSPPAAWELPP